MATNVTQKDETLHEIIDWCDRRMAHAHEMRRIEIGTQNKAFWTGTSSAYSKVRNHCESMLGYSGSMPVEVENQSEDA